MDFWNSNLDAMVVYQPNLVLQLREYKEYEYCDIAYEKETKDGNQALVLNLDGKECYMNSRFRPLQEAETYAEQFKDGKPYSVSVFFGFGNGMIPKAVCKHKGEKIYYVFYEPLLESFLYALHHCDLSELLLQENVQFYIHGVNGTELAVEMPMWITWDNLPLTEIYALPKYQDLFVEEYRSYYKLVRDVIIRAHLVENTRSKFAERYMLNSIHHMRFFFESTTAAAFEHQFPKDMPAILVSAGPSLAKNVQELKRAKNHAFILCVDTAVKRLMAEKITPDAVIGVDPQKWRSYSESWVENYKNMMWITETSSNYGPTEWNESYRNVMLSGEELIANDMFERYGYELPNLATGGSVANTAFSLLKYWGFKTIILVGQDLAFTGNKRYSDSEDDIIKTSLEKGYELYEVDEYYGGKITTRDDYLAYLKWFEGMIPSMGDYNVINATEGGALIHGATNMPLSEALDTYAKTEYNIREIIDSIPRTFTQEQKEEIDEQLHNLPSRASYFMRYFKEGKALCERAITLVEREHPNLKEYDQIQKRLSEIDAAVSNELEFILITSRCIDVDSKITRKMIVNPDESLEGDKKVLENMRDLYAAYYDAADEMKKYSLEMVEKLDEEGWR